MNMYECINLNNKYSVCIPKRFNTTFVLMEIVLGYT